MTNDLNIIVFGSLSVQMSPPMGARDTKRGDVICGQPLKLYRVTPEYVKGKTQGWPAAGPLAAVQVPDEAGVV